MSDKYLKLFLIANFDSNYENVIDYSIDKNNNVYYKDELIFTNFKYNISYTEKGITYNVYVIFIKSIEYVTIKFNLESN